MGLDSQAKSAIKLWLIVIPIAIIVLIFLITMALITFF